MNISPRVRSPRWPADGANERGSVSLQTVILFPAFILVLFGILQSAFWMHAQNVAQSAATTAYSSAKTLNGSPAAGQASAYSALGDELNNAVVNVNRTAVNVTVTVTGTSPSLVPGWGGPNVQATVSGPVERWVEAP